MSKRNALCPLQDTSARKVRRTDSERNAVKEVARQKKAKTVEWLPDVEKIMEYSFAEGEKDMKQRAWATVLSNAYQNRKDLQRERMQAEVLVAH